MGQEVFVLGTRHWPRVAAAAVAALLALGLSTFLLVDAGRSAPPVPLDGVDFAALEQQGIELTAPPSASYPRIQSETAVAKAGFPLPVKETAVARLVTKGPPELDRVVWAINYSDSLPVPGGPDGANYDKAAYLVAFVDAETGEFLFAVQSNRLQY